jgi:hypothetical protein
MTVAAGLTLLSPLAALVGLPALAAIAATALGLRRVRTVQRALRLPLSGTWTGRRRLACVAGVVFATTLAAAQPALTHESQLRVRHDVQVLFVVDISRSMAASATAGAPSRLDRATAAAVRLRAAVPTLAAGVATLTDRVLPSLLPVSDQVGFDAVMTRAVAIESPPPQASAVRATSFDALSSIPGAGYFGPGTEARLVVVLTDGESAPVQTGELARAYGSSGGYHVVFVRVSRPGEAIFDADGRRETSYRPDPASKALTSSVAAALRGNAYDERDLPTAERRLQELAGDGPSTIVAGTSSGRLPLAPYVALVAVLLVAALFLGDLQRRRPGIRWRSR